MREAASSDVLREQRADGGLDGGERGAQLVGDGVEQRGAQALGLLGGLGAGGVFEGFGALDGHGDEAAEGFHGFAREADAFEQQRAAGTHADAQRDGGGAAVGGRAEEGLSHGFAQVADDLGAGAVGVGPVGSLDGVQVVG